MRRAAVEDLFAVDRQGVYELTLKNSGARRFKPGSVSHLWGAGKRAKDLYIRSRKTILRGAQYCTTEVLCSKLGPVHRSKLCSSRCSEHWRSVTAQVGQTAGP